jgi:hypothetical protein
MKLLSPSVVRSDKAQQTERELLRAQEIQKVADKTRKDMANADADFKQMLLGQRARWERESQEHDKLVTQMANEVKILEDRKKQAMIPIEIYKGQVDILYEEASRTLKSAQGREQEAETTMEHLQDKLDAVGQKQQDLTTLEKKLVVRQEAIDMQGKLSDKRADDLSRAIVAFNQAKAEMEKDINERKTVIRLRDISQGAKDDELKRTERELQKWSLKLKDERETLARIYKRISPISPLSKKKK